MSYSTKYYARIPDSSGNTYTVNLQKQNYSGAQTEITYYTHSPLILQYRGPDRSSIDSQTLYSSSMNFNFFANDDNDFSDLFQSEYRSWMLEVIKTNYSNPVYDLLFSSGCTDVLQTGTGRTWSQTGSTAYVFLNDTGYESKRFYLDVDSLTDFKVQINNITYSGSIFPNMEIEFLDAGSNVQYSVTKAIVSNIIVTYTGSTPITRVQFFAKIFPIMGFPSTRVNWTNNVEIYQGNNSSTLWKGWVYPDRLTKRFLSDHYEINLEASDGLVDELKEIEFPASAATGDTLQIQVIKTAIAQTGIELDISSQINISETHISQPVLESIYSDTRRFLDDEDGRKKYLNASDTLEKEISIYRTRFAQVNGKWSVVSDDEVLSPVTIYDFNTLAGSTQMFNREIDISNYKHFKDSDSMSMIPPLKMVELTFQNRNISSSILFNGTFDSDINGWTNGGSPFYSFAWYDGKLQTRDVAGFSDPNTNHNFFSSTFPLEQIGTGNTLTISADIQAVPTWSGNTIDETCPYVRFDLVYPDTTAVLGVMKRLDGTIKNYSDTFNITQNGNYQLRVWVIVDYPTAVNTQLDVYFDNFLGIPNYGDGTEITFDQYNLIINTGTTAVQRFEKTIHFADSLNTGDLGQLKYSRGTGFTSTWSNYDGSLTNVPLTHIIGHNILRARQRFKNYVHVSIVADTTINFNSILNINGTKYSIVSMTHDLKQNNCEVDLVEMVTDAIGTRHSEYTLLTTDGKSSSGGGGGSVQIDGVSQAEYDVFVSSTNSSLSDLDLRVDTLELNSPITASNGLQKVGKDIRLISSDKGDITVSNSGATWTIDNNAITTSKIADGNVTNAKLANSSINFSLTSTGTDVTLSSSSALGGTATLNIPNASATARGVVDTSNQEFGGEKTFSNKVHSSKARSNTALEGEYYGSAGYWCLRTDTGNAFNLDVYGSGTPKAAIVIPQGTGNVGIGITPSYKLDVGTTAGNSIINITTSAAAQSSLRIARTVNTPMNWEMYMPVGSTDLRLYGNTADKFWFTNSGGLGIGASPSFPLDVYSSSNAPTVNIRTDQNFQAGLRISRTVNTPTTWELYTPAGSTDIRLYNTADRVAFTADGRMSINGSGTFNSVYQLSLGAGNLKIGESSTGGEIQSYSGKPLYINPLGNNVILNSGGGNVGIGVTPEAKLHAYTNVDGVIARFDGASSTFGTFLSHDSYGAHFYTNSPGRGFTWGANGSTTQMVLSPAGNLGIGGGPSYKLDVQTTAGNSIVNITTSDAAQSSLRIARTVNTPTTWELYTPVGSTDIRLYNAGDRFNFQADGDIKIGAGSSGFIRAIFADSSEAACGMELVAKGSAGVGFSLNTKGNSRVVIFPDATTSTLHSYQELLIQTTNTAYPLRFNASNIFLDSSGNLTIDGTGTGTDWVATSDRRVKENIEKVSEDVLEEIVKIGAIYSRYEKAGKRERGFIAQELLEISPEYVVVPEDPEQMMAVNYSKMTALLFKGFEQLLRK